MDDVVDAVPVHLFGGVWGTVATALFTSRRGYDALYGASRVAGRVEAFDEGLPCGLFAGCKNAGGMLASAVVLWLAVTIARTSNRAGCESVSARAQWSSMSKPMSVSMTTGRGVASAVAASVYRRMDGISERVSSADPT